MILKRIRMDGADALLAAETMIDARKLGNVYALALYRLRSLGILNHQSQRHAPGIVALMNQLTVSDDAPVTIPGLRRESLKFWS